MAQALWGYGLLQALVLLRLTPSIRAQAFSPGLLGFFFGVAALPQAGVRMLDWGLTGPVEVLAMLLFFVSNGISAAFALGTVRLLVRAKGLSAATPAAVARNRFHWV